MSDRRSVAAFICLFMAASCSAVRAQKLDQTVIFKGDYGALGLSARQFLDGLHSFEQKLSLNIAGSKLGQYDGHELSIESGAEFTLFMHCSDAEAFFRIIEPYLRTAHFTRGGKAILRYGPPGSKQRTVDF